LPSPRLLTLALFALPLAACHSKADDAAATAVEPIQQGSVSDAMLPLDKVTSEPPLAEPDEDADSSTGKAGAKAKPNGSAKDAAADSAPEVSSAPSADSGE